MKKILLFSMVVQHHYKHYSQMLEIVRMPAVLWMRGIREPFIGVFEFDEQLLGALDIPDGLLLHEPYHGRDKKGKEETAGITWVQ